MTAIPSIPASENGIIKPSDDEIAAVDMAYFRKEMDERKISSGEESGKCPHGYPRTVRCSCCGE